MDGWMDREKPTRSVSPQGPPAFKHFPCLKYRRRLVQPTRLSTLVEGQMSSRDFQLVVERKSSFDTNNTFGTYLQARIKVINLIHPFIDRENRAKHSMCFDDFLKGGGFRCIYIYTYMEASRFKLISQRHDDPMFVIYRSIDIESFHHPLNRVSQTFFRAYETTGGLTLS